MRNEDLKKILKNWDANVAPDASRTEKIKQNIMHNLDRPNSIEFPRTEYFYIPKKLVYAVAMAACICIAFTIGIKFNKPQKQNNTTLNLVSLSQDEIKNLKKISSEIDMLFPEGVKMISQVNNGDIQINTEPRQGVENSKNKVLIRYIVLKKAEGDTKWQRIHVSNLITSPGEPLELKGENKGYVWLYPADKNVYAIQSKLQIKANGETINLDYNGGQQLQISQCIKTIQENNMEYRIYQEVVRI